MRWKNGSSFVSIALIALILLTASAISCTSQTAVEPTKGLALDRLPPAAKAAIVAQAGKNHIAEITENGTGPAKCFLALWTADGKSVTLRVAPDGRLLRKEVAMTIDKMPPAVQDGFYSQIGSNDLRDSKQVFEGGKTYFQGDYVGEGHLYEVRIAADGTVIGKEEKRKFGESQE